MAQKIDTYLTERKEKARGGNQQRWQNLEELYSKKLWHPLALKLKDSINQKEFFEHEDVVQLYKCFIHEFEHRVNPLMLVEIILPIATSIKDPQESCKFLENIQKTVKNDNEAVILCITGIADIKLKAKDEKNRVVNIADIRALLEEAEKKLEALPGVTNVHGEFHRVNATYLQEIGDFGRFYQEALRYLGCVELENMKPESQRYYAFCLCLAALLGENVYNFGELLAHPILQSLKSFQEEWVVDLLYAFNSGNIDKFEKMRQKWMDWNDLKNKAQFLETKIRLLCLMEMSFARSARNRQIPFDEISQRAKVPVGNVERTVMKALSRDLIRGNIDEVRKIVNVIWVQPRVLDKKQINTMGERMEMWAGDVSSMENLVEHDAHEILTK